MPQQMPHDFQDAASTILDLVCGKRYAPRLLCCRLRLLLVCSCSLSSCAHIFRKRTKEGWASLNDRGSSVT
jgi:hypothetical protein